MKILRDEWRVEPDHQGSRLDVFLADKSGHTRSRVERLIREGNASVDGRGESKPGFKLTGGMSVGLVIPDPKEPTARPQSEIDINIIYQDDDLAVVAKPSGMVVHPAAGNPDGTLVNALMAHLGGLSGIGGETRPGIVHRIDKDTSGLLLVAKNDSSHVALAEQIRAHSLERAYLAVVYGRMPAERGFVDAPIGRHRTDRKRMAVVPGGREARTEYEVSRELRGASLLELRLTTGRTHQIRVHMAHIGHPVVGDPVYGPGRPPIKVSGGQLLHAFRLGFIHPTTGESMVFEMPPEKRFSDWVEKLTGY